MAQSEARDRQVALEHAEAVAKLQAMLDVADAKEKALQHSQQALEQELRSVRDQLLASQEEAVRFRVEAQTVQAVLDRLHVPQAVAGRTKPKKTTAQS